MENLITISNVKDNTLEFEVEITGIKADKLKVCFVIEVDKMNISFDATHTKKNKWSVDVPAVNMLKTTMYSFHIAVVADGYYFKPMEGSVNVVGTHDIYATKPENTALEPTKKNKESLIPSKKPTVNVDKTTKPLVPEQKNKKKVVDEVKTKDSGKLFKTIVSPDGSKVNKPVAKSVPKPVITVKEEKIKDILREASGVASVSESKQKPDNITLFQKKKTVIH